MGTYVLPMPEGHNVKKALYRQFRRAAGRHHQPLHGDAAADRAGRTHRRRHRRQYAHRRIPRRPRQGRCPGGGAAGRLGLPASGYLFGTYENPANCGDGYAMAFHAGAGARQSRMFPDQSADQGLQWPACAYVTGPLGGYTANAKGERFIECDYWSGQMMLEFYRELEGGNGPVFLKLDHLAEETIGQIETDPAHQRTAEPWPFPRAAAAPITASRWSRCTYPRSAFAPATAPRASGWTSMRARRCPAFMPPATWRACRTITCSAPSSTALIAGENAADFCADHDLGALDADFVDAGARARAGPDAARRRSDAGRGGIQDAPHGQRLSAAAESDAQDGDRPRTFRRNPRGLVGARRPRSA